MSRLWNTRQIDFIFVVSMLGISKNREWSSNTSQCFKKKKVSYDKPALLNESMFRKFPDIEIPTFFLNQTKS